MADGYVQVPPDAGGKKIDTDEIQTTAGTVERQRVTIPDTIDIDGDALRAILVEQRIQNILLLEGLNVSEGLDELRQELADLPLGLDLAAGVAEFLETPTSANLATAVTDETGTGALVFGTSPRFTTDIAPASDDGATLGVSSRTWSDLFMASGGVINWGAGNYLLTHSPGSLQFSGGPITPAANDGAAIGTGTISWSDLFLASGAVINFNNGNFTITHDPGQLTFNGFLIGLQNNAAEINALLLQNDGNGQIDLLMRSGGSGGNARFQLTCAHNSARNDMYCNAGELHFITAQAGKKMVFNAGDTGLDNITLTDSAKTVGIVNASPLTMLDIGGPYATSAPSTKTTNYSLTATDSSLIFNGAGSLTLTLQSAASYPGRWLTVKTIAAQTVVSSASNVVPLVGGGAGTAILAATAGKWALLQSDGSNWIIMAGN